MTLWSSRFDGAPDPAAFDFGVSFGFDRALFEDDVTGSIAWVEALGAAGVVSDEETRAMVSGLKAILEEGRRDPSCVSGPDEDIHSFVERKLIERIGDAGRRLHTGRSRNEQVSLDLRLYLRRRIPLLQEGVAALVAACANQAERAGSVLMPSYTHLRRAQPVLVAHFFLAHVAALRRDHARLAAASEEADALTLGSGAVAGTSYPIDTTLLARALGFSRIVRNSLDASSDRDFVASVSVRDVPGDGAPQPPGGGPGHLHRGRIRVLRSGRRIGDRQQHDAAEEEPGSAGARTWQGGARDRPAHGLARDDEGTAERLQQGPAGGQGSGV